MRILKKIILSVVVLTVCGSSFADSLQSILQSIYKMDKTDARDKIIKAINEGENVNTLEHDDSGLSSLARAAQWDDIELAEFLLGKGADPNGDKKHRPLDYVKSLKFAKLLAKAKADINYNRHVGMRNHIHQVLFNGEMEADLIQFFLDNGVDPFDMYYYGEKITDPTHLKTYLTKYSSNDNHKKKIAIVEKLINNF
jgi:ankyrin repeat protein